MLFFLTPRLCRIALALAFLVGSLSLFLPTETSAKDKSKPPVAAVVEGKTYQISTFKDGGKERKATEQLYAALKAGKPTEGLTIHPVQSQWIECNSELCMCVDERDCTLMLAAYCARPPLLVCGTLSDSSFGCSCLRGAGADTMGRMDWLEDGNGPEFLYP